MINWDSSSVSTLLGTLLIGIMLALGGCSAESLTGPQANEPVAQDVESEQVGDAATNDGNEGTDGSMVHNTTDED